MLLFLLPEPVLVKVKLVVIGFYILPVSKTKNAIGIISIFSNTIQFLWGTPVFC